MEDKKDDGKFESVSLFDPSNGNLGKSESSDDLLATYLELLSPADYIGYDELVNRFEPVLVNILHSHEEMLRYLEAIGIKDDSGSVLFDCREIINDEQLGIDEDLQQDISELSLVFNKLASEFESNLRKSERYTNSGDESTVPYVARAYLLMALAGYC